ncbi:MAG: hypothetical protein WDN04_15025 [Rhodospirillales bacterium]
MMQVVPEEGRKPTERLVLRQIPLVAGALVALEPRYRPVLAMSGGWSGAASQFKPRHPGAGASPAVHSSRSSI